jgi:hypothetical protein
MVGPIPALSLWATKPYLGENVIKFYCHGVTWENILAGVTNPEFAEFLIFSVAVDDIQSSTDINEVILCVTVEEHEKAKFLKGLNARERYLLSVHTWSNNEDQDDGDDGEPIPEDNVFQLHKAM